MQRKKHAWRANLDQEHLIDAARSALLQAEPERHPSTDAGQARREIVAGTVS